MLFQFCLADHPDYEIEYAQLVDRMIAIKKLFPLSMSSDNAFEYFLEQSPEHKNKLIQISNKIRKFLAGKFDTTQERQHIAINHHYEEIASDKLQGFLSALDQMNRSKGYSMIRFLQANTALANHLETHIQQLEAIYAAYQSFTGNTVKSSRKMLKTN